MASQFFTIIAGALFALFSMALGQTNLLQTNVTTNWNPTGEGCVDTVGFLSCYADQGITANSCADACSVSNKKGSAPYNTCVTACDQLWYAGNIGCWLQSCWNQVYSCGYQLTAMYYFHGTGLPQNSDVPFYPPPNNASAGACSCNLGYVYGNVSAVSTSMQGSNCEVIAGGDNATLYECECCGLSWPISNILTACPKSDLSIISLQTFITEVEKTLAPSTDKCAILNNGSETCVKNYNFPWVGTMAYNPLSLPAGEPGTAALSNTVGNAFTVFPSTAVVTLTLLSSYTSTITPASFVATAAANKLSISGTSLLGLPTSTRSTSVATTSTAAAFTTTTKASSGAKTKGDRLLLLLAVVLVIIGVL
ncbi:hypothetical protein F5882DRAFT_470916 [Hyaloscypha sp. PMI_1271]|nr:hypothetical protein F5882DRAFT_470916 [Hyaloscypha sp. PMI_1271]